MAFTHRMSALALFVCVVLATIGCGKKTPPPGPGGGAPPGGDIAGGTPGGESEGGGAADGGGSGNAVFDQNCLKCHPIGTAQTKGKAPNLSKVGAKPEHTAAWIAEHIKDPKTHNPMSKMPSFETKLKPEDIKQLADFLATMK